MTRGVNKSGGNMYPDTDTVNFYAGECGMCKYCYAKPGLPGINSMPNYCKKYSGKIRLHEPAFKTLGSDKMIFVNSCTDLCHPDATDNMIKAVLEHLCKYPNQYLIQTKDTERLKDFVNFLPQNVIIGTTIETDISEFTNILSKFPSPENRGLALWDLGETFGIMVSIEPIMKFNLATMFSWMWDIHPGYISVGANSWLGLSLPEPTADEITALVEALSICHEVRLKDNLVRLVGKEQLEELREMTTR